MIPHNGVLASFTARPMRSLGVLLTLGVFTLTLIDISQWQSNSRVASVLGDVRQRLPFTFTASSSSSSSSSTTCSIPTCPSDPFMRNGMIWYAPDVRDTRWLPFDEADVLDAVRTLEGEVIIGTGESEKEVIGVGVGVGVGEVVGDGGQVKKEITSAEVLEILEDRSSFDSDSEKLSSSSTTTTTTTTTTKKKDINQRDEIESTPPLDTFEYGTLPFPQFQLGEVATIPPWALARAAPRYTVAVIDRNASEIGAVHGDGGEDSEVWDFIRGKMVLIIGSSHDRNNVEQWCHITNGKYISWGGHTGGFCHIAWLNFTMAHWFEYGVVSSEAFSAWYKGGEQPPYTFERRFNDLMIPLMQEHNIWTRPELVIFSSLFWDEALFRSYVERYRGKEVVYQKIGYSWDQMIWHRSRVGNMVDEIHKIFPPNENGSMPVMYRTRHHRKKFDYYGGLAIFQMDQSSRMEVEQRGVKLFTWGEKLEGYVDYYDGDQHFPEGFSTYIFGDMTLFYMYRASIPGCWTCHGREG